MISYIIPTRDRLDELLQTLASIERLGDHGPVDGAEVVIADNASQIDIAAHVPKCLASGVSVRCVRLDRNAGAAGRNVAAANSDPRSSWLVMLDDDSAPLDAGLFDALRSHEPDAGIIAGEVFLPNAMTSDVPGQRRGPRESGGLPEVHVGCGAAIGRNLFLQLGGYDAAFGFYAEEYDLCARLLLCGRSVRFDQRFGVLHRKVQSNRSKAMIIERLMRNNAWVMARYAPAESMVAAIEATFDRYGAIAQREGVPEAGAAGIDEARATLRQQRRTPMSTALWDRFTGMAHARAAVGRAQAQRPFSAARLVCAGKNAEYVQRALLEQGVAIDERASVQMIATLSPGPMLDAADELASGHGANGAAQSLAEVIAGPASGRGARVIAPWDLQVLPSCTKVQTNTTAARAA